MTSKRHQYLNWDECFMQMAFLIAQRSKDPSSQVGAVIVDQQNVVIGLGYNGFPRGCSDDTFPWDREGVFLETKYPYVVHAEENAIYNANRSVAGCRMYCTLAMCNECVKAIIQCGITEVIYASDKYHHHDSAAAARKMLDAAGIRTRQYSPTYTLKLERLITQAPAEYSHE